MKKLLSLLLASALCLGLAPALTAPARAAGYPIVEAIPCQYDAVNYFSEGLAAVGRKSGELHFNLPTLEKEETNFYGFIDTSGREVVSCKYDQVGQFSEGLAMVGKGGWNYYGFIDRDGVEVIPCKYYVPSLYGGVKFSDGLVKMYTRFKDINAFRDGPIIDAAGRELPLPENTGLGELCEGMVAVWMKTDEGAGWGFADMTGSLVIQPQYCCGGGGSMGSKPRFSDGLAAVLKSCEEVAPDKMRYSYIDKTGREVFSVDAVTVGNFREGMAQVTQMGPRRGFIDKTGKLVIPYDRYTQFHDFSEGLAAAYRRGDWGFIDKTGREVVPCKYNVVKDFFEGRAAVKRDDKWGFLDKTGKAVVPCQYEEVSNFREGYAPVKQNGLWGYIDAAGTPVVPCQYEAAYNFVEGYAPVKQNGKYGFLAVDDGTIPPKTPTAYAATQTVHVGRGERTFYAYALKDEAGGATNYVKLRDVADVLSGSQVRFDVDWDGSVNIRTGQNYTPVGGELEPVFGGDREYAASTAAVKIDGVPTDLEAITLTDKNGGGHTYFKLRDLGEALGFPVDWSAETGVTIQTRLPGAAGELKLANGEAVTEENVAKALEGLKKKYPNNATWTERPYQSPALPEPVKGKEALIYAISDDVFGDLPITETHSDPDKLLVGDVIRYNEGSDMCDYLLVVGRDGERLKGVSLFSGLTIHWDTWDPSFFFGDDAFPRKNFTIFSRYPL